MKLIDNWKKSWKFASVQFSVIGAAITLVLDVVTTAWKMLPLHLATRLPSSGRVAVVFFLLVILGRVLQFRPDKTEEDADGDE